jgi:anti-sigma factor RsiW
MRNFTDEELTAYLDGEHEFAPVAEIDAALKTDRGLQHRLDRLMVDRDALKGAFDAVLKQAPAAPDVAVPVARANAAPWYRQAAAAAVLLGLGVGLGNWLAMPEPQLKAWQDYAAAYHVLYGKETLANITPTTEDADRELSRVSAAIGKPLAVQQVAADKALSYKRAQLLNYDGQPLVQIAYLTDGGEPVAFCIMRGGEAAAFKTGAREGLASAEWTKDGYAYLLIGGKDQALIETIAKKLSETI